MRHLTTDTVTRVGSYDEFAGVRYYFTGLYYRALEPRPTGC